MFDDPTPGKENLCGSFSTTNRFNKGKEVLQTATLPVPNATVSLFASRFALTPYS